MTLETFKVYTIKVLNLLSLLQLKIGLIATISEKTKKLKHKGLLKNLQPNTSYTFLY
jgi:hypothetical protein